MELARRGRWIATGLAIGLVSMLLRPTIERWTAERENERRGAGVVMVTARQDDWPRPLPAAAAETLVVRVLVLDFDPRESQERGARRVREGFGWNDPRRLAGEYVADVRHASGGYVDYRIVRWHQLDAFPRKRDGFQYTPESYRACQSDHTRCHEPDAADYLAILREHEVARLVDAGEVDEVWLFGGPFYGFFESSMAGPGAFDINGEPFPGIESQRAFAIMGFSHERGVAEMLHNLCHRTEATLARVYGEWVAARLTTDWARFAASAHQSRGRAGVGSCHHPPNATSDYDYANPRAVESAADDWLSWPNLQGVRARVSRENWGGPDYHRSYMRWWFSRLPRAAGTATDGRLANWWSYVFRPNELLLRARD